MMKKDIMSLDFLNDPNNYHLLKNENIGYEIVKNLNHKDLSLFHIEKISFDDNAPRKKALENVLSALRIEGTVFLYLIVGDKSGVNFYYGVAKDLSNCQELDLNIKDIGQHILQSGIKGNFRGSKLNEMSPEFLMDIHQKLKKYEFSCMIEGVPGTNEDNEKFQGVDRLVDVMLGDEFCLMIVAKPISNKVVENIEKNLCRLYSTIVPLAKRSVQGGRNFSEGTSETTTEGKSDSQGFTTTFAQTKGSSKNTTKSTGKSTSDQSTGDGSSKGDSSGTGTTEGSSESQASSKTDGTSQSKSIGSNVGKGTSETESVDFVNKEAQEWMKYLDEIIFPRIDYGSGKGIFLTTTYVFSKEKTAIIKLKNTIVSLYSGEKGNKVPLKTFDIDKDHAIRKSFMNNFQVPFGNRKGKDEDNENIARVALSQLLNVDDRFFVGNWITTNELSLIAGLPQKEIIGLTLNKEIEFGLNICDNIDKEKRVTLGNLVQGGNVMNNEVYLNKDCFDTHIFVTGVTGSGKTTTCQKLLIDSKLPFLIIEPAKTEYRQLNKKFDDILIFTLGKDTVTPFRLNPFEFMPHESITSRVDMIKASIEAAFDMEAAIPQIIETAIYESYKEYGWNISANNNPYFKDPFADGTYSFPTLSDLVRNVEKVVEKQGFDIRLKNDYIGSIKARLQGLLVGSKGLMLNTRRSIDFCDLLDKRVILELEDVRSSSEKSLIMGFILTNLSEAIKANYYKNNNKISHITLIEEAHRLFSKFLPGDSLNKKQGVETFTDILAEIRKYGESLIIVDQIPNKMTPEVLKNTNTKIIHRIFAQDDKEAIGNTIALEDEQKDFLSNLATGRAVVFTQNWSKAVQVQVEKITDTSDDIGCSNESIQKNVFQYYTKNYKRNIFQGLNCLNKKTDIKDLTLCLEFEREVEYILEEYSKSVNDMKQNEKFKDKLKNYIDKFGIKMISGYIKTRLYSGVNNLNISEEAIVDYLNEYVNKNLDSNELISFDKKLHVKS